MMNATARYGPELVSRLDALRAGWYSMGAFWSFSGVPRRLLRATFINKIYNTALSGIEAWVPTKREITRLSSAVASHARRAMRGQACDLVAAGHPR
eukprot:1377894-Pyramimonas_sp.AAC.1